MAKIAGIITQNNVQGPQEMHHILSAMALPKHMNENGMIQFRNFSLGIAGSVLHYNPAQTHYLAWEGEINNLSEIKDKLIEAGQKVVSERAEDLIIFCYQTWGKEFFKLLNGAFVIAIFDKNNKKIILGRDRVGCRTLFWAKTSTAFVFASQLKGLLASTLITQRPDLASISSYFFLGYFAQDRTPVKQVNRLLPGYFIEINEDENILINKYWSFTNLNFDTSKYQENQVKEEMDHLLQLSLQRRKIEGEACILNTGDIGSTALLKYARNAYPQIKSSVSIQFDGHKNPLKPFTESSAKAFGFENKEIYIHPEEMVHELQQIIWHLDEPIADPYVVGIWKLGKEILPHCKAIYSSIGSQEFLGSHMGQYTLSYEPLFLWLLYLSKPAFLKGVVPVLKVLNKKLSLRGHRFYQKDFWSLEYMKQQALFSKRSLRRIAPQLNGLFDLNLFLQQSYQYLKFILYQNFQVEDYLFFDAETSLSNRLLIQYENLFQALGIKFYSPYLDSDFIEYFIQLPEQYKSRGKKGALPLYELLQPELPEDRIGNFENRSAWFLSHWLQNPRMKEIFKLLESGVLVESNIINPRALRTVLKQNKWKYHQFERMWALLILEVWFNLFINNPITKFPKEESIDEFFSAQKLNFNA